MWGRKITVSACTILLTVAAAHGQIKDDRFDRLYRSGTELFQTGQYRPAARAFREAQALLTPNNRLLAENIDYYMAACAAGEGTEDAEALLAAFLKKYPNTIHANRVHLELGNMYQKQQEYGKSLAQYRMVNPETLSGTARNEFFFNRGYASFAQGDYGDAARDFDRVGNDRTYGASATYYKAYMAYLNDRYAEARQGFASLTDDRNYAPIIPFYLLHLDFKEGNYAAVVRDAPGVWKQATDDRKAEILRMTGESYYHLKNYAQAIQYLEAYATLHPDLSREERYMIGYAAYMTGDFSKAIDYLGKVAVGEDLLAQNAAYHIGSAALRMGDKQRAKQAFSLAMRIDADKGVREEAMFNFGKLQYELGNGMFNETIDVLTDYVREFPDSPHADEARGYLLAAYMNTKNYGAAYDALIRIKNPDNEMKAALQKITYFRGLEYFMEGDYAKAQEMLDQAAANRYNPKYTALTKFWQAENHYRQREYARAVPLYQDYIVLSPKGERENTLANYNLGYCYFNLKNLPEAQVWFSRFLSLYRPDDAVKADAYNRLGDVHFAEKRYTQAIENYDRAIRLGTEAGDYARYQRAIALGLTQGTAQKIEALQAIVRRGNSDYADDALYELGSTYTRGEQFDRAATTLKSFIAKYPDSPRHADALSDLGLIYQNMGNNAEALKYYKAVVAKNPTSSQSKDALLGIRNIYMDNNDLDGYYAFAEQNGIETNAGVVERDSLTYAVAERIYLTGDYRRACPLLEKYLSQYPKGAYVPNATYYVAECNMQTGDREAALAGYERTAAMPLNPFTINALLKAGNLRYGKEDYREAAALYRRLADLATNRSVLTDALLGYVRSTGGLDDADKAVEAAEYAKASPFATEEVRNEADFLLGTAYLKKGRRDDALEAFRKVADANMKTRNGSEAQYRVAELLFDAGKTGEAEAEILKFADVNTSHQYWLAKAFLLLGDIYVKKGDDFQAKATYQSIVDGYTATDDGIAEEAHRKLENLKK